MEYKKQKKICFHDDEMNFENNINQKKFEHFFNNFFQNKSQEEIQTSIYQFQYFLKKYKEEVIKYLIKYKYIQGFFQKIYENPNIKQRTILYKIYEEILLNIPKDENLIILSEEEFLYIFRTILKYQNENNENINILFHILIILFKHCKKYQYLINENDFQKIIILENETRNNQYYQKEIINLRIFLFYILKNIMKRLNNQEQIINISLINYQLTQNEIIIIYILKIFKIFIENNNQTFYQNIQLLDFIYNYLEIRKDLIYFQNHLIYFLRNIFQNEEMNFNNVKKIYLIFQGILQNNKNKYEIEEIFKYYQNLNEDYNHQELFYSLGNLTQLFTFLKQESYFKRQITFHNILIYFLQIKNSILFLKLIQEFEVINLFINFLENEEELNYRLIFQFFIKIIEISESQGYLYFSQSLYYKLIEFFKTHEFTNFEEYNYLMKLIKKKMNNIK